MQVTSGRSWTTVDSQNETDSRSISATYFFGNLDDSSGPYQLAPFFSRNSQLSITLNEDAGFATIPVVSGSSTSLDEVDEARGFTVSGRYVSPESGWIAGAQLFRADADLPVSPLSVRDAEMEVATVEFGKYINDSLLVSLARRSAQLRTEVESVSCVLASITSGCIFPVLGTDIEITEYVGSATYVGTVRQMTYEVTGSVVSGRTEIDAIPLSPAVAPPPLPAFPGIVPPGVIVGGFIAAVPRISFGSSKAYSVASQLYLTRALSFGVTFSRWDGDSVRDYQYAVESTWFVRRNFALVFSAGATDRQDRTRLQDLRFASLGFTARI